VCQGDFSHNIWGLDGGLFSKRAGEFGDRGEEGHFQPLGEASQAVLALLRTNRFPSTPDSPPLPTIGDKLPRSNQGPDASDRRSGRVDRNDPGRIRLALNQFASGQVAHGPWGWVSI